MNTKNQPIRKITADTHSPGLSILLHLLPGLLIGVGYYLLVPVVGRFGFPSITALNLAALLFLIPIELGILYYHQQTSSADSWKDIILYRRPLSWGQFLLWVPVIFLSSALILTLLTPISNYLQTFFAWIPETYRLAMGLGGGYSKSVLIITYTFSFLTTTLAAPIVEELYFRGYLMPRMPALGGWAPVVHGALFALYHTWSPWLVFSRTLALLPLIYIVRWKKNLYLGMTAHCLLNAIDVVIGIQFILQMT